MGWFSPRWIEVFPARIHFDRGLKLWWNNVLGWKIRHLPKIVDRSFLPVVDN
jgi:hypothetical protein